jgi:hypothetical protein
MDTKEAIEFLERKIKTLKIALCWDSRDTEVFNKVIVLLQQGEKYRLMVEEIEKNVFTYGYLKMNGEDFRGMVDLPYYKVEMIKDKYFPREVEENDKTKNK